MYLTRRLTLIVLVTLLANMVASQTTCTATGEFSPVQVLQPGGTSGPYHAFPDITRAADKSLLIAFYSGNGHVTLPSEKAPTGGKLCLIRSTDDGQTWQPATTLYDGPEDDRDPHLTTLRDGTLLCTFFSLKESRPSDSYSGLRSQIVRSTDHGRTWETSATAINPHYYVSAPVRELSSGTLALGLYDSNPEFGWGAVTFSQDTGKSWSVPVDIGKADKKPFEAETDLVELKDGMLYAALRSSLLNGHSSTSSDGGKTWSSPKDLGFKLHAPHFLRLANGNILLTHRLPKTEYHLSCDDAKTWNGPVRIDDVFGAYTSAIEVAPNQVLLVYYEEGKASRLRTRTLTFRN